MKLAQQERKKHFLISNKHLSCIYVARITYCCVRHVKKLLYHTQDADAYKKYMLLTINVISYYTKEWEQHD